MQGLASPEFFSDPSEMAIRMNQSPPSPLLTVRASTEALRKVTQLNLNLKFKVMELNKIVLSFSSYFPLEKF